MTTQETISVWKIKNEAILDVEYFIHELDENGLNANKFKTGLETIQRSSNIEAIENALAILTNLFIKSF